MDGDADEDEEMPVGRLKIPYGPFLALGAFEFLFFGDYLVDKYVSLFF